MAHHCEALVVTCIDFRFQEYLRKWFDKKFTGKKFDYVGYAGATKELETIMGQIDISVRLHSIEEIYLINHEDCGAYGAESTPKRHAQDLKNAENEVLSKYPELKVYLYYLHLDGNFEEIK